MKILIKEITELKEDNSLEYFKFEQSLFYNGSIQSRSGIYSIVVYYLELEFSVVNNRLVSIQGLFLYNKECEIKLPMDYQLSAIYLEGIEKYIEAEDILDYLPGLGFNFEDYLEESNMYFIDMPIIYDSKNGLFFIGTPLNSDEILHKVKTFLYIGFDVENNIKCLYIKPNKIVKTKEDFKKNLRLF